MTSSPSKYDYRRVYVSEALKEREGQLVELKKALADLGLDRDKSENFDDLFLLRFLLSNETVKAAGESDSLDIPLSPPMRVRSAGSRLHRDR
jgi:hypothetical protein